MIHRFLASTEICFALFLGAVPWRCSCSGLGVLEGVAAYNRGDYATALREWWPLA